MFNTLILLVKFMANSINKSTFFRTPYIFINKLLNSNNNLLPPALKILVSVVRFRPRAPLSSSLAKKIKAVGLWLFCRSTHRSHASR
jgi:hypothetical protein